MIREDRATMSPQEVAVCIGFDALRIAVGKHPKTFAVEEVVTWLALMTRWR